MMLELLRLYPIRAIGYSIAIATMFFFSQVLWLVYIVVDRYESTDSSTVGDLIWIVYKELPTALPMAAVFAIGLMVVVQIASRFLLSGPTVGELPSWIRNHPIRTAFNIAIVVLLLIGAIFSHGTLIGIAIGVLIVRFCEPWADWIADLVEGRSRSTDEDADRQRIELP